MMSPSASRQEIDEFKEKVLNAILGAQSVQAAYLGSEMGWYDALATHGPLTSVQLSQQTSSSERYAREWLEWQSMAGWIECINAKAAPKERLFQLPPAHAHVLANRNSMDCLLYLTRFVAATGKHMDELTEAYKTDSGISWNVLDVRKNSSLSDKYFHLHLLAPELEKAVPELKELHEKGGRICDIGCGSGYSSIGMALHFTKTKVTGYDLDETLDARTNIREYELEDRVQAVCADASKIEVEPYDLVLALECIHDMSNPVGVLKTMKSLAGDEGYVIIADPGAAEEFTGIPNNPKEQLMYGLSGMCCLATGKADLPSAETGTVMRPSVVRKYAQEAGFQDIQALTVEHPLYQFYLLLH